MKVKKLKNIFPDSQRFSVCDVGVRLDEPISKRELLHKYGNRKIDVMSSQIFIEDIPHTLIPIHRSTIYITLKEEKK